MLRERLGLRRIDLMALDGGRAVVRIPKANDAREVAVLGVVRIDAPMDFLVERFRDVEGFMVSDRVVAQVGTFSAVPSTQDLESLSLPEGDIEALRECKVGNCDVKLPHSAIERIRREVDWSQPGYRDRASEVIASELVQYLRSYMSGGNAALITYHDKGEPLSLAEGFRILHGKSRQVMDGDAGLHDYVEYFPEVGLPGAEDIFYWTVEDFGLKPVTSLDHMMIIRDPATCGSHVYIAIKRIYASHYFHAVIKLATLMPVSERGPQNRTYLVLFARMRFDGGVRGLRRFVLERRLKNYWTLELTSLRSRAVEEYRATRVAAR
jgi:hypothetical protein